MGDPADRALAERWGAPITVSRWLQALCGLQTVVILALCWAVWFLAVKVQTMPIAVIKEHTDGNVEVQRADVRTYQASEESMRFFLKLFAERHWRRFRNSVERDYPASLVFLSPDMQQRQALAETDGKDVEAFVGDLRRDDVDVRVTKVVILERQVDQDQRLIGGKALIYFDRLTLSPQTRETTETASLVAQVHFTCPDRATYALVAENPIGLQITYFRVD